MPITFQVLLWAVVGMMTSAFAQDGSPCSQTAIALLNSACCTTNRASTYTYADPVVTQTSSAAHGVQGFTTYRLSVRMKGLAKSLYSLMGSKKGALSLPPAFQVNSPFGSNLCGVNPQFVQFKPEATFDSWLTVGIVDGDHDNSIQSAGLTQLFHSWNEKHGLQSNNAGVFWMNPKKTAASLLDKDGKTLPPVVVAQLTVKTGSVYTATMGLVGNTINYGTWREDHMRFDIGGKPHAPPPPSGHRRSLQAGGCNGGFPKTCSAACADIYVPFMRNCAAKLGVAKTFYAFKDKCKPPAKPLTCFTCKDCLYNPPGGGPAECVAKGKAVTATTCTKHGGTWCASGFECGPEGECPWDDRLLRKGKKCKYGTFGGCTCVCK